MRIAGIFSEFALAFVGIGLALTAFGVAPNAGQSGTVAAVSREPEAKDVAPAAGQASHVAAPSPSSPVALPMPGTEALDQPNLALPAASPLAAGSAAATAPAVAALPSIDIAVSAALARWAAPMIAAPSPVAVVTPAATVPLTLGSASPAPSVVTAVTAPTLEPAAAAPAAPAAAAITASDPAPEAATGGTPGLKPAKVLFGAVKAPAPLSARAIGTYAKGCLQGGQALPVDGPAWQAMRLSRNRNWGHPKLISLIEKLAMDGKAKDGWPGLLVGDIAQPRGGPMLTGHASHQVGLDADIWLTPMPDRRLSNQERETIEATSMLSEDGLAVNRDVWTDQHLKIIKRAASYPEVERIFVHPAIKQVLCYAARDDRAWLTKVRPYWGHFYHFHVRISCPSGSADCKPQQSVPGDDGCGKELEDWLHHIANNKPEPEPLPIPPPVVAAKPAKEKAPMTLDQLPSQCRVVLANGNPQLLRDIAAAAKAAQTAADEKDKAKSAETLATAAKAAAPSASKASTAPTVKVHATEKKTTTQ